MAEGDQDDHGQSQHPTGFKERCIFHIVRHKSNFLAVGAAAPVALTRSVLFFSRVFSLCELWDSCSVPVGFL
jgi:hypothetical protein